MTTLVGIQGPDFVVLAADSQITDNDQRIISTQTPKIVRKGRYLLGVTGDSRPGDILIYNWKPPMYKRQDPVDWMGRVVIPSIYNAFKDNGYELNDKERASAICLPLIRICFLSARIYPLTVVRTDSSRQVVVVHTHSVICTHSSPVHTRAC